jgi:LmbE family N-acetylglucosaminyl deacetylase
MPFSSFNRRDLATRSAAVLAALHPALATAEVQAPAPRRALSVVCVGAHPDDPESGCGGTLALYAERGHRVTVIYLTRGEAGIRGQTHEQAAAIRTAEAEQACRILGARPVFAGQLDGATEVNRAGAEALTALLSNEAPDVLLTHWPIDTHPDHQAASLLALRAHLASPRGRASLYFFEVDTGAQTLGFLPTAFVDITSTREKKKAALFAHRSQDAEAIYRDYHRAMEEFRGREAGVKAAEAFVTLARDGAHRSLPGLG